MEGFLASGKGIVADKRTLDDNTADPMALAVAQGGRVIYVRRTGHSLAPLQA